MKVFAPGSRRWREETRSSAAGWLLAVIGVIVASGVGMGVWLRIVAYQLLDDTRLPGLPPNALEFAHRWQIEAESMVEFYRGVVALAGVAFGWHVLQIVVLLPAWWWARRKPWPAAVAGFAAWLALESALLHFAPLHFTRFRWIAALTAAMWLLALRAAWRQDIAERSAAPPLRA